MKIAFFTGPFPNLSETFILNQITGLCDRGHVVDVFANTVGNLEVVHPDVEKYHLLDRTRYYALPSQAMPITLAIRFKRAFGHIACHLNRDPWPLIKSLNPFQFGREAISLGLFYKTIPFKNGNHSYDVIQCHFGPNGNLAVKLRDLGVLQGKIVTTFHGYDISKYLRSSGIHAYKKLFKKGDLFLPISETWQNELVRIGCPPERISVHRMGIDTRKFQFSPRRPVADGIFRLLTVARLVEKKGVEYGMRAVSKTLGRFPKLEYTIAGDGPLRKDLEHLAQSLNLSNNIRFTGWINQNTILDLMKKADLLLAPSVTDADGNKEGIPVVLMEALALGLPVISTRHSGIPELIKDGKVGYLVQEKDVDGLSEKISTYLSHPEKWPQLGKNGNNFVRKHYDIHQLNDRLEHLFRDLLT